jgi:hypothetical protein
MVMEMAPDCREATLGKGARYTSTGMLTSRRPKGGITTLATRRNVATGGTTGSISGAILRVNRRRKTMCGGFE